MFSKIIMVEPHAFQMSAARFCSKVQNAMSTVRKTLLSENGVLFTQYELGEYSSVPFGEKCVM
jgi:hypothetical protein